MSLNNGWPDFGRKTWVYVIDFKWDHGTYQYMTKEDLPFDFSLEDDHGCNHKLACLEANEAKKTLGTFIAPNGLCEATLLDMHKKIDTWVARMKGGNMQRSEAWLLMTMLIMKSIDYQLTALPLTWKQCNTMMGKIRQCGLPKSSITRSFPLDVVHGPKKYQGLGIPVSYTHLTLPTIYSV